MTANEKPQVAPALDEEAVASLVEMINLLASAKEAMSDEIVTRLAGTLSEGMALLDRVNRSGIDRALPVLTELVNNNDVPRLVELARLVASVQDSMSDDIVGRVAAALSEGVALLDRLTRNEGLMRFLQVLDRPESQNLLIGLSEALGATSRDIAITAPARGGVVGMWRVARQPGTQEGVRLLALLGQHLSRSLRELHRRGG